MGLQQAVKRCRKCSKDVIAARNGPNHIVHLLMTVLTGGIWIVVWFLASIRGGDWKCMTCSSRL